MVFPSGSSFGSFILVNDATVKRLDIRQQITTPDGKRHLIRYPRKKYRRIPQDRNALQNLVEQLNKSLKLKCHRQPEIRTAFLSSSIMNSFKTSLKTDTPNQAYFNYLYNTSFKKYFLDFFIGRLGIMDPTEWVKHQSAWGAALMGLANNPEHNIFDKKLSTKTIKVAVQMANRFMKFLYLQNPTDYPLMVFQPIGKGALKTYAAELKNLKGNKAVGKFISDSDWTRIDKRLPDEIACFIRLMYHYGLRRNESMGFNNTNAVRFDFLNIHQQLKTFTDETPGYSILKDKEQRQTPHWFAAPESAHSWIKLSLYRKMHPDTLSRRWDSFAEKLGMDYKLHDFRRTFITRALRLQVPRDVQMAVGHADLSTTMKYAQDDRKLNGGVWKPD